MTLFDKRKEKLIDELKDKEYRDAFVSEHISSGVPFQIKALREQRELSQKALGKKANMLQERISVLEDPNYAKFTISTLKKIASAFDVGLVVRFVPFSELAEWELNLSSDSLKVQSFDEESYFKEKLVEAIPVQLIALEEQRQKINDLTDIPKEAPKEKVIPNLAHLFTGSQKKECEESTTALSIERATRGFKFEGAQL